MPLPVIDLFLTQTFQNYSHYQVISLNNRRSQGCEGKVDRKSEQNLSGEIKRKSLRINCSFIPPRIFGPKIVWFSVLIWIYLNQKSIWKLLKQGWKKEVTGSYLFEWFINVICIKQFSWCNWRKTNCTKHLKLIYSKQIAQINLN